MFCFLDYMTKKENKLVYSTISNRPKCSAGQYNYSFLNALHLLDNSVLDVNVGFERFIMVDDLACNEINVFNWRFSHGVG